MYQADVDAPRWCIGVVVSGRWCCNPIGAHRCTSYMWLYLDGVTVPPTVGLRTFRFDVPPKCRCRYLRGDDAPRKCSYISQVYLEDVVVPCKCPLPGRRRRTS
jgi:hypothetical protein